MQQVYWHKMKVEMFLWIADSHIGWLVHSHDPRLAHRWMDSLIISKKGKILAQSQYQAWLSSCSGILLTFKLPSNQKIKLVQARHPRFFDFP
jgi:ABC-type cobalamin/Fe3+-siderophores transport system ATPase subunit